MASWLGTTWPVFVGVTVVLMGFAAFMTGQALAEAWRPIWQLAPYVALLGAADRFLTWALFRGALLLPSGYAVDTLVLLAVALLAYRLRLVRKMTGQYPWLYERTGPFGWREKTGRLPRPEA